MPKGRVLHDRYFRQAKREGYVARSAYKLIELVERKPLVSQGDRVLDVGCAPGSWLQVLSRLVGPHGTVVGIDLKPIESTLLKALGPRTITIVGDFTAIRPIELLRLASLPSGSRTATAADRADAAAAASGEQPLVHAPNELAPDTGNPGAAGAHPVGPCGPPDDPANQSGRSTSNTNAEREVFQPFDSIVSDMAPNTSGHGDHFLSARLCDTVLDTLIGPPALLRFGGRLVMKILEGESFPPVLNRVRGMFDTAGAIKPRACRDQSTEVYIWAIGFRPNRAERSRPNHRPGPPDPIAGWGDDA